MSTSPPHRVVKDFDDFIKVHGILLAAAGVPSSLHRQLFDKLSSETFDGGEYFTVNPCEGGRQRCLLLSSDYMEKESSIFIVDHAWTFRLPDALKMLESVPGLAERMAALMCVDLDVDGDEEDKIEGDADSETKLCVSQILEKEVERVRERGNDVPVWLELEELGIDDDMLLSMDLSRKFPNMIALNLWGNKLQNADLVLQKLRECRNLRAIWLNENPVLESCVYNIADAISKELLMLEIFNSHFTNIYSKWSFGFCAGIYGIDNPDHSSTRKSLDEVISLDLSNRCIQKLLIEVFSPDVLPSLSDLNIRGNPFEKNSTDELLDILKGFNYLHTLEVDIPGPLGTSALFILERLPNLAYLNGIGRSSILKCGRHFIDSLGPRFPEYSTNEPLTHRVIDAMWLYLMTYRLASEEKIDETSVCYVMDELGSALRHSDGPNFQVAPFLYMPEGNLTSSMSYSVLWPIQNLKRGEECFRDFLFGIGEDKQRSARLTSWFHTPQNYYIQEFKKYHQQISSPKQLSLHSQSFTSQKIVPFDGRLLHVYTDIPQVDENLRRDEFVLTNDPKDADIIWTSEQIDDEVRKCNGLNDSQFINQFPFETCIVMKHFLAETIYKALGSPEWLQPTYNLETHLPALIGDYYTRQREKSDNLWILKPWNMARTIDTTVTGDLSAIIRLMETGPKICQKYIEHPALFKGRKFDLRYVVLVRSMNPVEIFLSDSFWVRLANNPYSLEKSSLFEYETHFTVMNYVGKLNHMNTSDFVREFEKEHQVIWLDIHQKIRSMIRAVFDSAATVHPDMHSPMSRAIYGVDVMLDSCFKPKLLEVTYCPDCNRACKYDMENVVGKSRGILRGQEFMNSVFGCLFLNEAENVTPL